LLRKVSSCGLSVRYITWFRSYVSSRSAVVRVLWMFCFSFTMFSAAPQGSILGPSY
jgi:hypothetical protein